MGNVDSPPIISWNVLLSRAGNPSGGGARGAEGMTNGIPWPFGVVGSSPSIDSSRDTCCETLPIRVRIGVMATGVASVILLAKRVVLKLKRAQYQVGPSP